MVALDFLILAVVALPALLPLAGQGYVQGADAIDHPWRSLVLREALKEGLLFPRWQPGLFYEYGFPYFNFYGPLPFYPAILFETLGRMDLVDATKLAFAANTVIAGFGAYLLAGRITGRRSVALLAGVFFMGAPFTLSEIYQRSNLAGSAGLAMLPFGMLAVVHLCQKPTLPAAGFVAAMAAVLILTHNVTGLVSFGMAAFLILMAYLAKRDRKLLLLGAVGLALGLGASSFFWAPTLGEKQFAHTEKLYTGANDFRKHFVNPLGDVDTEIFDRGWWEPYQISSWGPVDLHLSYPYGPPPYKLGLFQGLLILLGAAMLVTRRGRPAVLTAMFILTGILYFLHSSWSRVVWESFPPVAFVGFPWRLTGLTGLLVAVVGAWAVRELSPGYSRYLMPVAGAAMLLTSVVSLPTALAPFADGLRPDMEGLIKHEYKERNRAGTWADSQLLPMSVQWENTGSADILPRYDESFPPSGWVGRTAYLPAGSRAWIREVRKGQLWMEARVEAGEATRMAFHTIDFPGWTAYVDGNRVPVEPSGWTEYEEGRKAALGVVQVDVPEGSHLVRLAFEDTPIRTWSNLVSVGSLLVIGGLFALPAWRRGRRGLVVAAGGAALVLVLGGLAYQGQVARAIPWTANPVILDLVGRAEERSLAIEVPEGGKADDYVHPRSFVIGGQARPVVYMHPPSSASARLWVPQGAALEFGVGVAPEVWDKAGDGVRFELLVRDGGRESPLYSAYLDPKSNTADRAWRDARVDLGDYAHREVELVFRTSPGQSGEFDWGGWSSPRVVLP